MAPGTWASGATVVLVALIHRASPAWEGLILGSVLVLIIPVAVIFSTRFSQAKNHSDPSQIVVDEIIGQIVCFMWIPISTFSLVAGFVLFRFFDIVKPFPVQTCERLSGGMGIVADDVVAGLYAGFSLRLLLWSIAS